MQNSGDVHGRRHRSMTSLLRSDGRAGGPAENLALLHGQARTQKIYNLRFLQKYIFIGHKRSLGSRSFHMIVSIF